MSKTPAGYAPVQIGLHWAVAVLVTFQYVAHKGIESAWDALRREEAAPAEAEALTYLHITVGSTVLALALIRIGVRLMHGAPPPPKDEPRLIQLFAEGVHLAIYGLLLLLPLSGLLAWFLGAAWAASIHVILQTCLLGAISLHVAGALFQHFIRRSDVLMRMLRTAPDDPAAARTRPGE
jgi:cytochrome b561